MQVLNKIQFRGIWCFRVFMVKGTYRSGLNLKSEISNQKLKEM